MRIVISLLAGAWFIFVLLNFSQLKFYLLIFIIFVAIERFWETFILSKQNILSKKVEFDWLFKLLFYYYIFMLFGTVGEYIFIKKRFNSTVALAGIYIFLLSLVLRLWAIRALGGNWNTCVLGKIKRKLKYRKLVQRGPYRFSRHPIYLGTIMEALSIPLVFNSYFTLGFVALLYLPLIILRAYLEEKELVRIFGKEYKRYQAKTIGF